MLSVIKKVSEHPRISREKKIIEAMVRIYCKNHHGSKGKLCPECSELFDYAKMRLDRCPFQEKKYMRQVLSTLLPASDGRKSEGVLMKYSGPRMLLHHPGRAIYHLVDGRKKPEKLNNKTR